LDWVRFNTSPFSGGLYDQPIQLLRNIKNLLNVHNAINAWKSANAGLSGDGLIKWMNANKDIVKFMEYVWSLDVDQT
jgi:hypothetical protein